MNEQDTKPLILVVDDQRDNLTAMESILDETDAKLVMAASGNEAVAQCLSTEFALILMDVQMPGMDGFEAMRFIRQDRLNRDTPVIFLSAVYSDDSYKIKGIQEGAVDFMTKPIAEGILIGKVNVFLTMYRQREQLSRQMNEILFLNRDLENYSRILAHDLKQPLNGILGSAQLLLLDSQRLPEKDINLLHQIKDSGFTMNDLINDALELIENRNQLGTPVEIDLHALLADIDKLYKTKVSKPLELRCEPTPGFYSHEPLLKSIFRNLIGNAIKYNRRDRVEISIEASANSDRYTFSITDNGIGIPPEKQAEIFQPFKRAHNSEEFSGSGIGLSIVSSATDKLGGRISIERSDENGTVMLLTLPNLAPDPIESRP